MIQSFGMSSIPSAGQDKVFDSHVIELHGESSSEAHSLAAPNRLLIDSERNPLPR